MNKDTAIRSILPLAAAAALAAGTASCNKDSSGYVTEYETAPTASVTALHLKADTRILSNLDSVFFSIDLNHGVIFNADSLPKGTPVNKLIPVINYSADITAASLTFTRNGETVTTDYKKNPSDTIDFTAPVTLKLTGGDGLVECSYTIKVNVHRNDPDSLIWDNLAVSPLPSRLPSPRAQKAVQHDGTAMMLIEENDGSYTWATSTDIAAARWEKKEIKLPAATRTETMRTAGGNHYVLAADGQLLQSADGIQWTPTGQTWLNTIGAYGDTLLGIGGDTSTGLLHVCWPQGAYAETPLEPEFPVRAYSAFNSLTTEWSDYPVGLMTGGRLADGTVTGATWGFDGNTWAMLDATSLPPLQGAVVVPYLYYRPTTTSWIQREFDSWLLIGGRLADGEPNTTVYMSLDNGVHWTKAPALMQLPDFIKPGYMADGLIMTTGREANLADAWSRTSNPALKPWMRIAYDIDGYIITWQAPYLYLTGGVGKDGQLDNAIWRAVLARLNYAPLI